MPVSKTLFGIRVFEGNQDKLRSYWIRVALNSTIDVLIRKERFEDTGETQGRRPCDDGDRECTDVSTGQGT